MQVKIICKNNLRYLLMIKENQKKQSIIILNQSLIKATANKLMIQIRKALNSISFSKIITSHLIIRLDNLIRLIINKYLSKTN